MDVLRKLGRKTTSSYSVRYFGNEQEPAIARYFTPEEIARFHSELSLICEQRRARLQALTAREINEQAARILTRAAQGRKVTSSD
jgi:hypothetical protein